VQLLLFYIFNRLIKIEVFLEMREYEILHQQSLPKAERISKNKGRENNLIIWQSGHSIN